MTVAEERRLKGLLKSAVAEVLEERQDLLAPFVIAVARNGTGNMPRIPRGEVSDAQLARIAAYLAREPAR